MTNKKNGKNDGRSKREDEIQADLSYELDDEFVEEESSQQKLAKLRKKLKEAKEQGKEYLTGWQKERADFMNYKTAEAERMKKCEDRTVIDVITKMLPVLDSFDMAFSHKESWEKVDASWRKGVEFIHSQLLSVLSNYGVERIDTTGVQFDPTLYDPVEMVPTTDEKQDHLVAEIVQAGYKRGEVVIRPAKVKVYEFHKEGEKE